MMEIDFTLDQLPEQILTEIFTFVQNKLDLRLVCKTFKNVIDFSAKLMKDKWLIVDDAACDNINSINYHYQNFIIFHWNNNVACWMSHYKHKDLVKSMDIRCNEIEYEKSATKLQYILLNYNSLETLIFEPENADFQKVSDCHVSLISNRLSKLKTLNVGYFPDHYKFLEIFTDIPSIKNLTLIPADTLKFPSMVKWKLEELICSVIDDSEGDDENCKLFLKNQQSTLKKLIFEQSNDYAYFIMRNLPNLEHLKLSLENDAEFNDDLLLRNGRLCRLDIEQNFNNNGNIMKIVLNHYNRIKYLSIVLHCSRKNADSLSFGLKLENLTHLALNGFNSLSFLNSNALNIKVLVLALDIDDENYDFPQLSNENFINVEKLSILFPKLEDVIAVVQKCPKLVELFSETYEWPTNHETFIMNINQILEVAVNVKRLGITEYTLRKQQLTQEELLSQISRKGISLDLYENFQSTFADDWGQENAKHIKFF